MSIRLSCGVHVTSFHWPRKVICISLMLVGWDNIICFQEGTSNTTNIHFSKLPLTEHIYPLPTGDNPTTHGIRLKILGLMMVFTLVGGPINRLSSPYSSSTLCLSRIRITIIDIFIQRGMNGSYSSQWSIKVWDHSGKLSVATNLRVEKCSLTILCFQPWKWIWSSLFSLALILPS